MATCNGLQGSNLIVKVKNETNFGLTELNGFKTIFVKTNTIKYAQNSVASQLLTAGRSPSKPGMGNIDVTGAIEFAIDNLQTGFWLKNILGAYTYAAAAVGTKNKHTFKITDTCLPSFQVEKTLNGSDVNYKSVGLKAKSFNMSMGGEGELLGTCDIIGTNEYFSTIQTDSTAGAITANVAAGVSAITLASVTGFNDGDVITLVRKVGSTFSIAYAGNSVIELNSGEGLAVATGDLLYIGSVVYQVKAVSGDKVYLSRPLETTIAIATKISNVSETNMISTVDTVGKILNLVKVTSNALSFSNSDKVNGESKDTLWNGNTFQNVELAISSATGGVITAAIETLKFTLNNNSEGKRLLSNKGMIGRIADGSVAISCDLAIVLDTDNVRFIEASKLGTAFDITIQATASNGDYLKITMPTGTLTPTTPEISTPGSISVSVIYSPFKNGAGADAIVFELVNDATSY
jgi:hypothetical protein